MLFNPSRTQQSYIVLSLLILLIFGTILLIGFFAIQNQQAKTEEEIHSELTTIAEMKASTISDWFHERRSDAEVAMNNQMLVYYLIKPPGGFQVTDADLTVWMKSLVTSYGYHGIVLLSKTGEPLIAVPETATVSSFSRNASLETALTGAEPIFTDLFLEPDTGAKSMEFWVPIRMSNSDPSAGVLVLQINPEEYLYPLIQSWPSPSRTAESLITREVGGHVVFLNELRHVQNTSLTLTVPISQDNVPAVMAAKGFRGIVKGDDYRGVPVVASLTNITGTPWFIVAKIDQEEIYAPFREFSQMVMGIIVLLFIVGSLLILVIWRTRENEFSYRELQQKKHELYLTDRIRLLMQQANDAIMILDKDWRILEANDRAVEMYGYSREEFQNKILFDLRSEEAKEKVSEDIAQLDKKDGIILVTEHQKKDGTIFPVEDSIRMVDIQGTLYRQAIIRDDTVRKAYETDLLEKNVELYTMNEEISASYEELASQQEELRDQMETIRQSEIQLQEMHKRLTEAQKAGHVGVWEFYIRTGKIWGSDECFEIYGFAPSPDGTKDISEVLACIPEYERVQSAITDTIENNTPFDIEFVIHPADGTLDRTVVSLGELHRNGDGNPIKIAGILQDITEKRRFEADIRQYQKRLSAFFNSPVIGTLFGDIYGSIFQANDEFLRIIGYSREDFDAGGIRWTDITPEEFLPLDDQGVAKARETGSCTPYEKQYIRKDGSRIWVLVGYILLEPEREESVAFILDISKAKESEEKIKSVNLLLEERVIERTNQLTFINEELQTEVEERLSAEKKLQETLSVLSATIESTADGLFVVNASRKISVYNKTFIDMWQIPDIVIRSRDEQAVIDEIAKQVLDKGSFSDEMATIYSNPDIETSDTLILTDKRIIERYSKPQRIGYTIVGRVWSFRDVTKKREMELQIEKSLREKEILLKEIHHRVKNNMQVVSSLLFMQSRLSTDPILKEILLESQNRVKSIALVHEELYQSKDLDQIDYNRYLKKISRYIFDTYKIDTGRISLRLSEKSVYLNISKAVPCSLIINELISNSLKHAFPDNQKGSISIMFILKDGVYHLNYADDGIGMPESSPLGSSKTLGLELIKGLVKQLSGTIEVDRIQGTGYEITFPE